VTHYSLLDGLSQPHQISDRCLEINAKSCALTDHGNISGAIKFYTEMKKNSIKPIIGCELYIASDDASIQTKENKKLSHLLVMAKNYKGWKNLIEIVSLSNRPNFYYHKPRLDLSLLKEYVRGDLICICGHLGSFIADKLVIADKIVSDWKNIGIEHINSFKDIFGKDNFFLESQLMDQENLPIQKTLTDCIRELGIVTDTKVVCTPDAHYCRKTDAIDQRILLCNNLKTTFGEISKKIHNHEDIPLSAFFTSDNFHILSQEEMHSIHTEEEIENTNLIDSMCEEYNILDKPNLPSFNCPAGYTDAEYLRELCRKGWKQKIAKTVPENDQGVYVDRIKYELDVLQGANLSSYFLLVQDIVNYVKNNDWLPGPGRGCFLPDTRVKMSSGLMKNICDIRIGDMVIDCEGRSQKVYDILVYEIEEEILELWFGDIVIRCTKDHKFLTSNRGWVEAQYLTEKDDVLEV